MKNGKCRMHGGKSTGPKTNEGRQRIANAQITSSLHTRAARTEKKYIQNLIKSMKATLASKKTLFSNEDQ